MNNKLRLLCIVFVMLLLCVACGEKTDPGTLTLCGDLSSDMVQQAGASLQVQVKEVDTFFFTDTMLLNQLVSHDSSVDIYFVSGNMVSTAIIFRKDFAAPLTYAPLKETVAGMYAPIQSAVTQGDEIMGMPLYLSTQEHCLAYQLETCAACQEEGYLLPDSWMGLLEQIIHWDENLWALQIAPVNMTPRMLIQSSLDMLLAWQQRNGKDFSLTSPEAMQVLEASFLAGKNMEAHQGAQMQKFLFYRQGLTVGRTEYEGFSSSPLPLFAGEVPVIPLRVSIAFINPYSPKQDMAQRFLQACYEAMEPDLRMALSPGENQPLENESVLGQIQLLQENITLMEATLQNPDENLNREEMEQHLAENRKLLSIAEQRRYRVDEASLQQYGSMMACAVVLTEQRWQEQSVSRLMDQLLQEKISLTDFGREMERIFTMQQAEK